MCLAAGTEVLTSRGLCKIEDFANAEVYSAYDDTNKIYKPSMRGAKLIDNGTRDVVRVSVTGSKPVVCTADHRFLVQTGRNYNTKENEYIWKEARDLVADDRIVVPKNDTLDSYKSATATDVDYAAVGWIMGDGWQRDYTKGPTRGVCFGASEHEAQRVVIGRMNEYMRRVGCTRTVKTQVAENGVVSWASPSAALAAYLEQMFGITSSLSKDKLIPEKIMFECTPTEQASFLAGLFSADGTVGKYGDKTGYVGLSSASQEMLYNAQSMLRCFGIHGRVVYGEVEGRGRSQGNLTIYGYDNLTKFKSHIGFVLCPAKAAKLDALVEASREYSYDREWHAVKSVEPCGQGRVYDLTVPGTHTFVANGVATHNCNLASLSLPAFVVDGAFDFEALLAATRVLARNLDRVIDLTYYPIEEARRSNLRHRPVGIGAQGLQDVFFALKLPFDSPEAAELNRQIFETVYFGALSTSCELARELGTYSTFAGSPASRGLLQYDLWGVTPGMPYAWDTLKADIAAHGLRNSLSVAPMPTASTANIFGK